MKQHQYRDLKNNITVFHNKNEIPCISVPHLHSQYEIYYNISGARGFMVNGEVYCCDEKTLIFIPKLCTHKVIVRKNTEYERCIINVDEYVIDLLKLICQSENVLSWINADASKITVLTPKQHDEFISLIELYSNKTDEISSLSVFTEILAFLGTVLQNPIKPKTLGDESVSYSDMILKIAESCFKTVTVAELASKVHLNEDYITRVFKEETGMTVNQYLIMRKLAEAKKLLYLGRSVREASFLA